MELTIFNHVNLQKQPFYYASLERIKMCCLHTQQAAQLMHKHCGPWWWWWIYYILSKSLRAA